LECEQECRPIPWTRANPDSATLALDDAPDDAQSKTVSMKSRTVNPLKGFEGGRGPGRIEADPVVADEQHLLSVLLVRADLHARIRRLTTELHGVADEVHIDLAREAWVGRHFGQLADQHRHLCAVLVARSQRGDGVLHNRRQPYAASGQRNSVGTGQ